MKWRAVHPEGKPRGTGFLSGLNPTELKQFTLIQEEDGQIVGFKSFDNEVLVPKSDRGKEI